MKVVIQRVSAAEVRVQGKRIGGIGPGLVILVAVLKGDNEEDTRTLCDKIPRLRIFGDEQGRMNRSLIDVQGYLLVVSQFTLAADLRKGLRPGFDSAADPQLAESLYDKLVSDLRHAGHVVETGVFGAMMEVSSTNDGPATFILDTRSD
jgi:D-aminoacyl-tRNA deacylase